MSKCTKIGEAAKRRIIILYESGRLFWLVEVDSVFFINSVSSICVIITKSSCFIVDENQWYRLVVDSMVHETSLKLLEGRPNIIPMVCLEITVSIISRWVGPKHRMRRRLHFEPEIFKLAIIWRFCKESPKPCILEFFGLPAVNTQ